MNRSGVIGSLTLVAASLVLAAAVRAEPEPTQISYYYDAFNQSVIRPTTRALDLALLARKVSGSQREAPNVDPNDEVLLPSTWWQPRLGHRPVTVEQMLVGPGPGTGPVGKWTVTSAKTQGITPGFQIKDEKGQRFIIKFDPPANPEMATGADVVCTYLYWAAGYNVPDNTIVTFRREDLAIDPQSRYEDERGRKRPISDEFMTNILKRVHQNTSGGYRAVASRFLSGKPLGEWRFTGRRKDDPEDLVPHQHRREIRGLYPINAWLNHVDHSARNTLDMWVTDGGRSFVRHHLIDFGACLGSASVKPHSPQTGFESFVDFGTIAGSLAVLGLVLKPWEAAQSPHWPAVGFYESVKFDPAEWRPFLPNPAFDERTERDLRWGARIVAGFTDAHVRAAVERAQYSDPRVTEYLVKTIIERRDKVVQRFLGSPPRAEVVR